MVKGYPPEFWEWAYQHGLPPRGPTGSPENVERMIRVPQLYSQWIKLPKVDVHAPV